MILRLVLADGSEQWRPGKTIKWTRTAVYVAWETTPGETRQLSRAWLAVEDVRRVIHRPAPTRTPAGQAGPCRPVGVGGVRYT